MNKIGDFFRAIFISIEFVLILFLINIKIFFNSIVIKMSYPIQKLIDSNFIIIFTIYIPLILASHYLLKDILFRPKNSKILIEWPLYPSLKMRCLILILYPVAGLIISIILLIFQEEINLQNIPFLLFITIIPSISGIISSYIAHIELNEILIRYTNNGD